MKNTHPWLYRQNNAVYAKKLNGQWVLLEQNKEYIREMNDTAGYIWSLLASPKTLDQIIRKVSEKFKCPRNSIEDDIKEFIDQYVQKGFIEKITKN